MTDSNAASGTTAADAELDRLRAEVATLTARAEQAEADRAKLARLAHRWNTVDQRREENEATEIASDGTEEALEGAQADLAEAWHSASGALTRAATHETQR